MASRLVQAISRAASLGLPIVAIVTVLSRNPLACKIEAWTVPFLGIALLLGESLRRRSPKAIVFNIIVLAELALLVYYRVH